ELVHPAQSYASALPSAFVLVQANSPATDAPDSVSCIDTLMEPSVRSVQSLATSVPSTSRYGCVEWVRRDAALVVVVESQALKVPERPALLASVWQIASAPTSPLTLPVG